MTEELGAISVGLRVGLGTLDRDIAHIEKKIGHVEREHTIPFKVGRVNTDEIQREIAKIARGQVKIPVNVTLPAGAGRALHRELVAQLRAAGPVTVQVKANVSRTEITRIKREIEQAMRRQGPPINVPISGHGGGGGVPPAAGGSTPATPPPRPRSGTPARSAPARPTPASGPSAVAEPRPAPVPVAPRPSQTAAAPVPAPKAAPAPRKAPAAAAVPAAPVPVPVPVPPATREDTRESTSLPRGEQADRPKPTPAAARAPRAARPKNTAGVVPVAAPSYFDPDDGEEPLTPEGMARIHAARARRGRPNLGATPTGPASSVAYRTLPDGTIETVHGRTGNRTADYLQKKTIRQQGRTVSTDTLRRDKTRVSAPETEDEMEYASRPTQAFVRPDAQTEFELEKRGRGVRGAGRSGAREHNEPVLTATDHDAISIQHDDAEAHNAARRETEVRAPARKSSAYYGSRTGVGRAFGKVLDRAQFYRFDPTLRDAFLALEDGELGEARGIMRGFSAKLAGVDPRDRKKFFRLFHDTEKVPPELLEKHAALQGLFAEIGQQEATTRVAHTEAALAAFPRPKGPRTEWPEGDRDRWDELLGQRKAAYKFQMDVLQGIKRREGGGRVGGRAWFRGGAEGHDLTSIARHSTIGDGVYLTNKASAAKYAKIRAETAGQTGPGVVGRFGVKANTLDLGKTNMLPDDLLDAWEQRLGEINQRWTASDHPLAWVGQGKAQKALGEVARHRRGGPGWVPLRNVVGGFGDEFSSFLQERGYDALKAREGGEGRGFQHPSLVVFDQKRISRRAVGGPVEGPLQRRLRMAREAKESYLVGEKKPELFVGDSGKVEIVGQNGPEVRSFPESGKIEPHVPEWIRRGLAKDLTHREGGGPVRGFGNQRFRSFAEGERDAIKGGVLGRSDSGSVQRVFVMNWPAGTASGGGFVSNPSGASRAAGPLRFSNDAEAEKYASLIGGHIGRELHGLLGSTAELTNPTEPAKETSTRQTLSPLEALENRLGAGQTSGELRERILGIRSAVGETQQQIPVRSLAPAFGQIAATVFGGRGEALARLNKARDLTDQASRAASSYGQELKKLSDLETRRAKGEEGLDDKITEQSKATKLAGKNASELTDKAEGAAKAADSLGLKLRVLTANTVGIVGGTLAFAATLGAAQLGLSAVEQVLTPVVERMTGFTATSAALTTQLAQQTKQTGGAAQAAFAFQAGQAGIGKATASVIGPLLAQRAAVEDGNKTLSQGIDLLHNYEESRRRGGQEGITRTSGGFFGTALGGTASTQELIKNELNAADAHLGSADPEAPAKIAALQSRRAALAAQGGNDLRARQGLESLDNQIGQLRGNPEVLKDRIAFFNDALDRGGSKLKFLAGASEEVAADFAKVAERAGKTEIAETARGVNRVILVDQSGKPVVNPEQVNSALQAVNLSQQTPDPDLLIKQLTERIIPAQRAQFAAEGRLQRTVNTGQFALQNIAEPTPGVGNVPFGKGITADDATRKAAQAYKSQVGGAVEFVNDQINTGRETLLNLVPSNLRGEFSQLLGDIEATGKQISNIQLGIQQQQVNVQVAEYNNQLRIARRSLQDAKDIQAGLAGETRNTLGGLEGQNIALQRQLQLLQFELQQRQINFKVATAGFVAPGTTPEERAARIEEAKIEANFAQKQLDIQKQLANNQYKSVKISVDRNVTDLLNQISLLQQGRAVTINTAAAARALDVLNKKQSLLLQQAGSYIEEGVKITQAAIEAASEVQKQTGKGFAYLLGKTAEAWGIFGHQAQQILNALTGTAPKTGGGSGTKSPSTGEKDDGRPTYSGGTGEKDDGRPTYGGGAANGIVGDTLGPTQLTVGEAAGEKVAVLKNPKLVPYSALATQGSVPVGSGGGAMVAMTVIISGNSIREDTDLTHLAEMVAEKVERRLMQKTSLFGLRRA